MVGYRDERALGGQVDEALRKLHMDCVSHCIKLVQHQWKIISFVFAMSSKLLSLKRRCLFVSETWITDVIADSHGSTYRILYQLQSLYQSKLNCIQILQ